MLPKICSLGPVTIHSYGLLIAGGVFLSIFLMTRDAQKYGFPPPEKIFDLVFVVVFAGFVGARLFYVIQEWPWYRQHPAEVLQIWKGGLVYYGGMITSFAAFFLYLGWSRLPLLATSDFVISYIPLAHAFGRIGCFLNGCCYGRPTSLPWGVQFPFLAGPVHPTQLYETLFNLGLFGFLVRFYPKRRFAGEVTALYLVTYSIGRFVLELYRGDQPLLFFGFTLHQLLSVIFIWVGMILYGVCRSRAR
jgi:phosphatidylglycerol:prolipoprotein diacylglycerol transferase